MTAWDAPEHYGVACKRVDARDAATRSVFNSRRTIADAVASLLSSVDADLLVLSYNDEAWLTVEELVDRCAVRGAVEVLAFESRRYVGAQIGIHSPSGERVGEVSHLHNREYLVVAGSRGGVRRAVAAAGQYP